MVKRRRLNTAVLIIVVILGIAAATLAILLPWLVD